MFSAAKYYGFVAVIDDQIAPRNNNLILPDNSADNYRFLKRLIKLPK